MNLCILIIYTKIVTIRRRARSHYKIDTLASIYHSVNLHRNKNNKQKHYMVSFKT